MIFVMDIGRYTYMYDVQPDRVNFPMGGLINTRIPRYLRQNRTVFVGQNSRMSGDCLNYSWTLNVLQSYEVHIQKHFIAFHYICDRRYIDTRKNCTNRKYVYSLYTATSSGSVES